MSRRFESTRRWVDFVLTVCLLYHGWQPMDSIGSLWTKENQPYVFRRVTKILLLTLLYLFLQYYSTTVKQCVAINFYQNTLKGYDTTILSELFWILDNEFYKDAHPSAPRDGLVVISRSRSSRVFFGPLKRIINKKEKKKIERKSFVHQKDAQDRMEKKGVSYCCACTLL